MTHLLVLGCLMASGIEIQRAEIEVPGTLQKIAMIRVENGEKSFWLSETEVVWDIFGIYCFREDMSEDDIAAGVDAKVRPSRPYGDATRGFGYEGFPALGMTDNSARFFCEWLNKKTGKKFRLPSQDEWLKAAGPDPEGELEDYAWVWENADDMTHPVKSLKPNKNGFFDMLGNAQEWVALPENKFTTMGGSYMAKKATVKVTLSESYSPKWQEADAHVPKSKWWLSDGPHIGMRLALDNDQIKL